MKQHPIILSNDFDEADNDMYGNEPEVEEVDEHPSFFDEEGENDNRKLIGKEDEDSFNKEGIPPEEISPNEACYLEVDPIEPNALIPLNDS